jgi:uncharacterized membrane protein (DUF485 family)
MSRHQTNEHDSSERRKSNIGVKMTLLYAIIYGGFVALNVFYPALMGVRTILGLTLALAYGLGLIIVAIIFAIIYNQLVRIPKSAIISQTENNTE